ncbi:MAG: hypothetical protein RJA00_1369 [Bacteroidota bacterium]|jgi:ABC-type bacteriocin/lantibiotic exporter with double-glycine peptidase domain
MVQDNQASPTPISLVWNWVLKEKKNIQFILIYAIVSGLLSLAIPLGIQALVGTVMAGKLSSSWVIIVIVTTTFVSFTGATKLAQISILDSIQKKLFVRYAWIYKESIAQLNNTMTAKELSAKGRKFLDIVTFQKSFSKLLADFTKSALQIVVGILLLTIYHPVFLLVGIGITLAIIMGFRLTWKSGFETARLESNMKFETYESILSLTEAEKDAAAEQIQLDNFHNSVENYVKYREEHFKVLYRQAKFGIFTKTMLTAIMLIVGSYLLVNNQISLGQFLASEILIITLLDATEKLILSVENIYDSGVALEKLNSIDSSKKWEASI